ncbi:MAG: hypothetical protein LQ341_001679 [Variospora aurantia]|nr:MAG: hypothetical protein LQ341_001679 [Variospora aurantia]
MWWPIRNRYPEHRPEDVDTHKYDYVVIGGMFIIANEVRYIICSKSHPNLETGGTAGCVVASRLSEDPNTSILVLERGLANDSWMSRIPLVGANTLSPDMGAVSWYSEAMKYCANRQDLVFRGEVLGGTSRINGMIYTRGSVGDYDTWASTGYPEWAYDKVLPYFVKAETTMSRPKSFYRGDSGLWINQDFDPSTWLFERAAEALGFGVIEDMSSPDAPCDGLSSLDSTVDENRQRVSTMDAYLPSRTAHERQANLTLCTGATVCRIDGSNHGAGYRADRVTLENSSRGHDKVFSVKVKKEVVVCAGALGSPQILMLSGIGPRQHLEQHGVEVMLDLPGVGSELSDHTAVPVAWEVPIKASLTHLAKSPFKGALEFLKYVLFRKGVLSLPIQVLSLFVRTSSLEKETSILIHEMERNKKDETDLETRLPDIEVMPLATSAVDDLEEHERHFSKIGVFSLLTTLLRPKSRGTVRLRSPSPHDRPKVDLDLLSDPEDFALARKAVRLALRLGDAIKAKDFPLLRGVSVPLSDHSVEDMDKFIRHRARTTYHYSSTCRMASEHDAQAPGVVDESLRVHGTLNLRVCDASVFPQILACHLMAPVVMVAEKCANMIQKDEATKSQYGLESR